MPTTGTLVVDGQGLSPRSLVRVAPDAAPPAIAADGDVELLVKVGGPR
ncbi:hypothetical protein [Nocardioides sp. TF02-7]|nr:hypothetical protein [Nocardioides sp. TF02-7]UMG93704.1 hypothetical protein MF408_05875 [Nocardioides sp. TF02-7]